MIRFEQVSKEYTNGTYAVNSLDFEIRKGEFFVLIGPSGSGKTTTLKMINRLISLTRGTVWIHDKKISDYDINELRWNIGYVLQEIGLFPHMSIAENIAVVPELLHWDKQRIANRVDELLTLVGLDPGSYRNRKPSELSGGQQQRIGVVRALAGDPEILLMDEPFSALDPFSREKLQDDLLNIQRKIKKTIVFVTHDMREALKLGDRICVMKEGEIVQISTPNELLTNPVNDFVREFVGSGRNLTIKLEDLIIPISQWAETQSDENAISISADLDEVLEELMNTDSLPVKHNGEVIGIVNRQHVLKYLADYVRKGGREHE
ncbi:glycine/betaine ABC transporter ATP-binding protein [Neobacillus piezotolerans]|uniref:Carnitine transport ATP-binding protein OpuCA n=1 Tax=Neobacillus piezotolerans TaxID=2259171 RepID=A0A3D8GRR2_9BACI|nr:osmoprotectant update ABC transporter ATP-binding subunit OpuFA [Neobacillus piezotolerans]RDU37164.1 glycine/betaine ABC transporter ATP-binding protein [Neobacillus piezotolerans]